MDVSPPLVGFYIRVGVEGGVEFVDVGSVDGLLQVEISLKVKQVFLEFRGLEQFFQTHTVNTSQDSIQLVAPNPFNRILFNSPA